MGQAKIEIRTSPVAAGRRHAFFVFTKEDGSEYVVRAGPSKDPQYSNVAGAGANPDVPVLPNGDAPVPEVQLRVFVDDANGRVAMSAQGSVFPNIPGSGTLSNWISDVQNSGASEYAKFEPLADDVFARVQEAYPGYQITIVGHSLAGGEAQTFALANGISVGTLDSLPIAPQSIASIYGSEDAFNSEVADWRAQGNTGNAVFTQGEIADAFYRQIQGEYYLWREAA